MFFVFDCITKYSATSNTSTENNGQDGQPQTDLHPEKKEELPAIYRQMQAWVGIWIENNGTPRKMLSWNGEDEKEGFKQLFDGLNRYKDFGLIHFGARTTHLPMFTYKAMQYGLIMPRRLSSHDITYRYSKSNKDLRDLLSNYGADTPPEFSDLITLLNLPNEQKSDYYPPENLTESKPADATDESTSPDPDKAIFETICYRRVICIYLIWLNLKHAQGDIDHHLFKNLRNRGQQKLRALDEDSDS